jgi:succinate dehydrogenase/fumarate reductase-like Fe-S protein
MNQDKNTILFTLVYRSEEWQVQTSRNSYPSLMSLISAYLPIIGFGLCSGMGSCGTCVAEIDGMRSLSCEVAVNDELANTRVVVSESGL